MPHKTSQNTSADIPRKTHFIGATATKSVRKTVICFTKLKSLFDLETFWNIRHSFTWGHQGEINKSNFLTTELVSRSRRSCWSWLEHLVLGVTSSVNPSGADRTFPPGGAPSPSLTPPPPSDTVHIQREPSYKCTPKSILAKIICWTKLTFDMK